MREAHVGVDDGHVVLRLEADEDVTVARWAAERQRDLFERAFGRELRVSHLSATLHVARPRFSR